MMSATRRADRSPSLCKPHLDRARGRTRVVHPIRKARVRLGRALLGDRGRAGAPRRCAPSWVVLEDLAFGTTVLVGNSSRARRRFVSPVGSVSIRAASPPQYGFRAIAACCDSNPTDQTQAG